jgi:hypothetical protein
MPRKSKTKPGGGAKAYWAAMTPQQRSREMRRRRKAASRKANHEEGTNGSVSEIQLAYISGRVEEVIQSFARSQRVSYAELAERVGELLAGAPGR